jgi:hypothetical protein
MLTSSVDAFYPLYDRFVTNTNVKKCIELWRINNKLNKLCNLKIIGSKKNVEWCHEVFEIDLMGWGLWQQSRTGVHFPLMNLTSVGNKKANIIRL